MLNFQSLIKQPIFWVVCSLLLVVAPHLSRFPGWSIVFILFLFLWRLLYIQHPGLRIPKWLLAVITISSSLGIFLSFGTLLGKTAGSVLLSLLLAIKLHESFSRRDYMMIISLSFFIIVTNFLFSQSIPTVVYMLAIIIVLVMSMISINQGNAPINIKQKFKLATKMVMHAIPLMLISFILFPRISGPLWSLPDDHTSATTGLSETMSPGNISNLIKSNAPAFRVEFKDRIPDQNQLYWRALVLWYFDGRTWEKGKNNLTPSPTLETSPPIVSYTITMEPHQKNWLFALDIPAGEPDSTFYTNDFVLRSKDKITSLYQYRLKSSLNYIIQSDISFWENSAGLKIPPNSNSKTVALGERLAKQYNEPEDIVNHMLRFFNQQNFHYTLRPPATPGFDPVDQFIFDTQRGFCEHYASSFTLIMRAAGIPARVVLGYQGGTKNPINNVLTIRQSDAHAWSEVWLKNRGWVRIDPTAAIAPQRIEQNLDAALDPDEYRPFHMQLSGSIFKNMMFYWDALDNHWNQWIVGYDAKLQKKLLESVLNQRIALADLVLLLVSSFFIVLFIIILFIIKPWKKQAVDPVVKIYNQFCKKISTQGIKRDIYEGPVDFAERAIKQLPEQKSSILLITRLYIRLRYEALHSERQFDQFRQLTRKFKPG